MYHIIHEIIICSSRRVINHVLNRNQKLASRYLHVYNRPFRFVSIKFNYHENIILQYGACQSVIPDVYLQVHRI